MPFFKSLPDDAGPPGVFTKYPEIYGLWWKMNQALMNGESPLSQGEREMILACRRKIHEPYHPAH